MRRLALLGLLLLLPAPARADGPGLWISQMLRLPIPKKLTFCGEAVPLGTEDVSERLDLELVATLGSPVRTTLWFKRIPRYFPMIEQSLHDRGLPDDLKYLALVESNLRADATSYAGAAGPWQFMGETGAAYGLSRASWRDERRDWDKATRAALDHLADLRAFFGSWPLALAAYNAGKERVRRAMEEQGESDYFGLVLPRETERYVFRVLAAKLVVENPAAYGIRLDGARVYPPRSASEMRLEVHRRALPVAAVAQSAGVSYRMFVKLNPWIRGTELPRGTHRLTVPDAARATFVAALAQWKKENPEPTRVYYSVRRGDTLFSIARHHDVKVQDLCVWNQLSAKSVIRPGQELVIQSVD